MSSLVFSFLLLSLGDPGFSLSVEVISGPPTDLAQLAAQNTRRLKDATSTEGTGEQHRERHRDRAGELSGAAAGAAAPSDPNSSGKAPSGAAVKSGTDPERSAARTKAGTRTGTPEQLRHRHGMGAPARTTAQKGEPEKNAEHGSSGKSTAGAHRGAAARSPASTSEPVMAAGAPSGKHVVAQMGSAAQTPLTPTTSPMTTGGNNSWMKRLQSKREGSDMSQGKSSRDRERAEARRAAREQARKQLKKGQRGSSMR